MSDEYLLVLCKSAVLKLYENILGLDTKYFSTTVLNKIMITSISQRKIN